MAEKMEVEGAAPEEQVYEGIDNSEVRTKYNTSAQIVNEVLAKLLSEIKPGVKVVELCEKGDKMINEKVTPLYKKNKKMQKGVAFPTCININNVVCHNSPLEDDTTTIKQGDVVRIDLGVHLDGFIALAATTVIVQEGQVTGVAADALAAANTALEAALRTMKPGKKNTDVTNVIEKVASTFGVNPCEGVLSHQLKRFVIDGNNVIILKPTVEHQVEEFAFQENEVYSVDIVLSTGAGKLREVEPKTTIYKRNPEVAADLKRKTSRQVYNDVAQRFATLPFTIRTLDKKTGRIGVLELFRTGMVDAYPVLCEKQGETVVQVKTTVLITSNEVIKATATPLQQFKSEKTVTDNELLSLLKTGLKIKKPSAKKEAPKEASTSKGDAMEVESQ